MGKLKKSFSTPMVPTNFNNKVVVQKKFNEDNSIKTIKLKKAKSEVTNEFENVNLKKNAEKKDKKIGWGSKTISKKEKAKLKKEVVIQKLELTKEAFREDKNRKKREKTAVIGDLRPLLDSLPSLDSILTLSKSMTKSGVPNFHRRNQQLRSKRQLKQERIAIKNEIIHDRFDHMSRALENPPSRQEIVEQIRKRRLEQQKQQQQNEMET
ncbi:unnamed protein product [Diamesa serratosioi]